MGGRRGDDRNKNSSLAEIFGLRENGGSDHGPATRWMKDYLLPLGSVLIAALTFLTQKVALPRIAIAAAVVYLVIVAGAPFYRPTVWLFLRISTKRKLSHLANSIGPRLDDFIVRLNVLLAHGHSGTVMYVFGEIAQDQALRSQGFSLDQEHVETIRQWLSSLETRGSTLRADTVLDRCRETGLFVQRYNRFCMQNLRVLEEALEKAQLQAARLKYLRQQWNTNRGSHLQAIDQWVTLAKEVNRVMGRQVCLDYYESIGTLE